jgi:predicted  nucleic acid-binding Zn-ribbon protein
MDQETREFLEQMAGMVAREFARINGRLDRIDERLDRIENRLDRVENRLDEMDKRFEQVERRLGNLDATVYDQRREMKSEFASVRQSIDALTTRVEALEQGV